LVDEETVPPMFRVLVYWPFKNLVPLLIDGNTVCIVFEPIVPWFIRAVTKPVVPFTVGPNPIVPVT